MHSYRCVVCINAKYIAELFENSPYVYISFYATACQNVFLARYTTRQFIGLIRTHHRVKAHFQLNLIGKNAANCVRYVYD